MQTISNKEIVGKEKNERRKFKTENKRSKNIYKGLTKPNTANEKSTRQL